MGEYICVEFKKCPCHLSLSLLEISHVSQVEFKKCLCQPVA